MTRVAVAALALLVSVGVAGCSSAEDGPEVVSEPVNSSLYVTQVPLPDGRTVTCIERTYGYGGGLSCDWDNAH